MELIRFSQEEVEEAERICRERWKNKERVRPGDPWRIKREADAVRTWVLGYLGEAAVARYLDVPMPQRFDTRVETDGGFGDLILPNGRTVSVRTLTRPEQPWGLYTDDPNGFIDDYGVLVWVGPDLAGSDPPRSYLVVGWFDRDIWFKQWMPYRYGRNYPERAVIDWIHLRPMHELKEEVERMRGRVAA